MRVKLAWLMGYGGPYPGSSIPLLRAALGAADERGWEAMAIFGEEARHRPWLAELRSDGYRADVTEASWRGASRCTAELVAAGPPATILHTHYSRFDVPAALRSVRAPRPRPPVFWHVRTALKTSVAARAKGAAKFGVVGRTVDGIFTPSTDLRRQVIQRGARAADVHALPHGLDTERFSLATVEDRHAARRELGLDEHATVLLHFGWDWHRKGGDLMLEAVRHLVDDPDRTTNGITVLSSQGGDQARELASRLGIADRVRVLPATDRVETLYAAADVMLATSRAEGGMPPFAVAEALSRGTPVVATDIPDHAFAAERTPACRLAPHSPPAIAAVVSETLARPDEQAGEEAELGHAWVVREKGMAAWVAGLFGYYEEALARRGH